MKLSELIETLQEFEAEIDDDAEVVAAYQETYPLAGDILGAKVIDGRIWIAVGSHPENLSPYAPREAFQ